MSSIYADIESRSTLIASDFGYDYAVRNFGKEFVDSLPKYKRGKRKGLPKGSICWIKCVRGGWVKRYGVERRKGRVLAVGIDASEWGELKPNFVAVKGLSHHVNYLISRFWDDPAGYEEWGVGYYDTDTDKHINCLKLHLNVEMIVVPVYQENNNGKSNTLNNHWVEDKVVNLN